MSKKSKAGSRTPSRTPRAKTPVIKNIVTAENVVGTINAVANAIPTLSVATIDEVVTPSVYSIDYRRIFLMVLAFAVAIICIVLFVYNGAEQKDIAVAEFGTTIPTFMFSGWFVILFLVVSLLGFGYAVYNARYMTFAFMACAILYLVSLVMIFVKLYFSISLHSSAVQVFGFIFFVSSVLLILQLLQCSCALYTSTFAMIPSVLFSGFVIYTGGLLNPRV
jgi:hypothetical protein